MKLILSLALIWMLSSTAEALQCLHNDRINTSVLKSCTSADEMCGTIITTHEGLGLFESLAVMKRIYRSCVPSSLCAGNNPIFSFSDFNQRLAASFHCCNTDGCNNQHLPYPDIQVKNGLQCVRCVNPSCNEAANIQCVGAQDRCIKAVIVGDVIYTLLGCASANLCEVFSRQDVANASFFFGPLSIISSKCCGSSFCNSAWTVKLSVAPLLLGLVALVVY